MCGLDLPPQRGLPFTGYFVTGFTGTDARPWLLFQDGTLSPLQPPGSLFILGLLSRVKIQNKLNNFFSLRAHLMSVCVARLPASRRRRPLWPCRCSTQVLCVRDVCCSWPPAAEQLCTSATILHTLTQRQAAATCLARISKWPHLSVPNLHLPFKLHDDTYRPCVVPLRVSCFLRVGAI